jgi:quercetin dioxygenase-like cupin family protein
MSSSHTQTGKHFVNTITGQEYLILQDATTTEGVFLEMESVFAPHSVPPPVHYHPVQREDFTVLQGELTVVLRGKKMVLRQGDSLHIPAGAIHGMWNASPHITRVHWLVQPALNTAALLETFTALANQGRTDGLGKPSLLQAATTLQYFTKVFRLVQPPRWMQQLLFPVLALIGRMIGLRPVHREPAEQRH